MRQVDIDNAFLHDDLLEDLYIYLNLLVLKLVVPP